MMVHENGNEENEEIEDGESEEENEGNDADGESEEENEGNDAELGILDWLENPIITLAILSVLLSILCDFTHLAYLGNFVADLMALETWNLMQKTALWMIIISIVAQVLIGFLLSWAGVVILLSEHVEDNKRCLTVLISVAIFLATVCQVLNNLIPILDRRGVV